MAWCSPFSIVTGTSPEAPPIGTWSELMILTLCSADVTYSDRPRVRAAPRGSPPPRQAADCVASSASSRERVYAAAGR